MRPNEMRHAELSPPAGNCNDLTDNKVTITIERNNFFKKITRNSRVVAAETSTSFRYAGFDRDPIAGADAGAVAHRNVDIIH